jgi:hypothetical protein
MRDLPGGKTEFSLLARQGIRRAILIAAVQGLIGPFDEYFAPLNKAGRSETGERAQNHFLEKRGPHGCLRSTPDATESLIKQPAAEKEACKIPFRF